MSLTPSEERLFNKKMGGKSSEKNVANTQTQSQPQNTQQEPPGSAIELITQDGQLQGDELAGHIVHTQKGVVEDVTSLAVNADNSAKNAGFQKFLIVASYRGNVDKYANQYLEQYQSMAIDPPVQASFGAPIDLDEWAAGLTNKQISPFTNIAKSISGKQSAALPESQSGQA